LVPLSSDAQRFYLAARRAGALANVIDKPGHCDVQLGSIVNRSPVVVAISTDGGAPILAQALRRRIETLLPLQLARWGLLAKQLRARVGGTFATISLRRTFRERFSERAMTAMAPSIAARLTAAGLSPATPMVTMSSVARQEEQRRHGDLATGAAGAAAVDCTAPVVIGIGAVFEALARSGATVLDTADSTSKRCTVTRNC
jgi:hypothetical protein